MHGAADVLEALLGGPVSIYTVIAVRRVSTKSSTGALFKSVVLALVYLALFARTVGGVIPHALLRL